MSFLTGGNTPQAPAPPPPPPAPTSVAQTSIMQEGAAQRSRIKGAQGSGFAGTDVTGGQGAAPARTTKSLLGG